MIKESIFRAYDIRGNAESDLSPEIAHKIGYAFAKMTISSDNNRIIVGRDGRLSSPVLCDSLISGLTKAGANVTYIGIVTSPMLYFADKKISPAGSMMVTASHNPKEDNGFKMIGDGKSFFGDQIQDLKNHILNIKWPDKLEVFSQNMAKEINVTEQYLDRIFKNIKIDSNLKIAFDPANGSAGNITKLICQKMPCETKLINCEIDGNFPAHKPDPTVFENLAQLRKVVLENSYDLGIGFDGDGDRIGVITKSGKMIYGDQLLCILAKEVLARHPGAAIIADVKASKVFFDYVSSLGGKAIMWKTGHSFIKAKMQETKALLAGEMSGHIFFADDYYGYDDAVYAALRLIHILSMSKESIDEMIDSLPKTYNTPEIRIEVPELEKFKIVENIKKQAIAENMEFIDIDGLRVTNKQGWWLLRPSNTQAAIIARCESNSKEGLVYLQAELNKMLKLKA